MYKIVKTLLVAFLFLCLSVPSFSNPETEQEINKILDNQAMANEGKLKLISDFLEKNTTVDELEKSNYYHDISKLFYGERTISVAIASVKKAVSIRRKHKDTNPDLLKKSLFNLGFFYSKNGNINQWYETYKELLTVGKEDRFHAKVYVAFGRFYREKGDFAKAIESFEKAQRFFEVNHNNRDLFLAHLNTSLLYANMGRVDYFETIIKHLEQADSINRIDNVSTPHELFIINQRLGNTFLKNKKFVQAELKLKEALQIASTIKDSVKLTKIYNNLGLLFLDTDRIKEAYKALNIAKSYANTNIDKSFALNNLGDYYLLIKDYKNAESSYLTAFNILNNVSEIRLPKVDELEHVPNKLDALSYLNDIVNFYYQQYTLKENAEALHQALASIVLADKLIDIIRIGNTENVSKLIWRKRGASTYMKGVEIAHLLNKPEQAFYFMEKNKGLLLLEDITIQQARVISNIPDSITIKESNFQHQIKEAEIDLANEKLSAKRNTIKNELFSIKKEYQFFTDSLKTAYPNYFTLKKEVKIAASSDIGSSILKKNTAIVAFMLDQNQGYTIVKTDSAIQLVKIDAVGELNQEIATLKQMVAKPFYDEAVFKEFNHIAHNIYKKLFAKVENILQGKDQFIIIPDGELTYIPFEVLQPKESNDALSPNYLLYEKHISYAYSVNFLLQNNQIKRNPKSNFLAVAPISFTNELVELPDSEHEIDSINQLFDGKVLQRAQATKQNFIDTLNHFNIIHISSHANFDQDKTTWLWFYDTKLKQTELYGLKNQADMVVLSACKTSVGEFMTGEGLNSLARAFFSSGAKSVLSSLWNTNDKSNTDIMIDFYKELKHDKRKDIALTHAKTQYLKSHFGVEVSPYYWASTTIHGAVDFNVINTKTTINSYLIIGLSLAIGLLFFTFRAKK